MRVGVLKEIKPDEYRVSLTPAGARELVAGGHEVLVQAGAGEGSFLSDGEYRAAGARILPDAEAVFQEGCLLLKVKEPQAQEYLRLRPDHVLFTYLHLAPGQELTRGLIDSGATCVAYETVETADHRLPLLAPMSEIAGRIGAQAGAYFLERMNGGKGRLLGGATGVAPAEVVVLGAGIAGSNAALIAAGMRACVKVLDVDVERLRDLERYLPGVQGLISNRFTVEREVVDADLVVGAVLVPGGRTPVLVSEDLVRAMQPGSVIVDISVDQGGSVATCRMTTHSAPTYTTHGVVHYCVGNMPGVVPITSTWALTNATLPYVLRIADVGLQEAARTDESLARGINVMEGKVTNRKVAEATGNQYFPLNSLLPIEYT
jgi:alanine dehydrogenase